MGERLCRHFPIQPSWGNIDRDKKDVKDNRKSLMVGQNASKGEETIQNAGNQPDFCLVKKFDQYCSINKSNIDFRRYLQLITNIGLDLIKYDVLYARKVVAKYRLEIIPENKDVKVFFDKVLQKSTRNPQERKNLLELAWKNLY